MGKEEEEEEEKEEGTLRHYLRSDHESIGVKHFWDHLGNCTTLFFKRLLEETGRPFLHVFIRATHRSSPLQCFLPQSF